MPGVFFHILPVIEKPDRVYVLDTWAPREYD